MVNIQNVTKGFGNTRILENTSYSFPDTGLVCLLGPSGSGKTTLLNLLAGFDSDYEGSIQVCGQDLRELDAAGLCAYRRDRVGFVFQNYHLLPGFSVLENVLTPAELTDDSPDESREKALALLERLGMREKAEQRVETLSGGQKQRTAIARALMGDPRLILADEPTGALDRRTSNEIMELLKQLSADRLVVVITHDAKVCDFADEVLCIRDRKLEVQRAETRKEAGQPADAPSAAGDPRPARRARRNFRIHLGRFLAVALAISLGLLAFLFSLSFGNVMDREILGFQEKNTAFNNGYIKGADDGSVLKLLQGDERIAQAYYQYKLRDLTLTLDGRRETLEEKIPMPKTGESLSYGVMPRQGAREIALTPSLAKKFAPDIQNLLGRTLTLSVEGRDYELTVSGIFNAGYDDLFVSADVEQEMYRDLSRQENYSISYDVKGFDDVVAVDRMLEGEGIYAQNAAGEVGAFQESFRQLERLFTVISALVLFLALFLCCVLLHKLQSTRYRELGLLAALGFQAAYLRGMIRWENLYLSAFSAAVSGALLLAAALLCRLADFPLALGAGQVLLCVGGAFAVIITASTLASAKLIRTEPAQALKH